MRPGDKWMLVVGAIVVIVLLLQGCGNRQSKWTDDDWGKSSIAVGNILKGS